MYMLFMQEAKTTQKGEAANKSTFRDHYITSHLDVCFLMRHAGCSDSGTKVSQAESSGYSHHPFCVRA